MRKRVKTLWVAAICCVVVTGAILSVFLVGRRQHFSWNMQAVWVTADGATDGTVPFSARGYVIPGQNNGPARGTVDYSFLDGSGYKAVSGTVVYAGYRHGDSGYFGTVSFGWDPGSQEMILVRYAVDPDKEYIIFQWNDGSGRFLAASPNADVSASDIMAHFKDFVESTTFD